MWILSVLPVSVLHWVIWVGLAAVVLGLLVRWLPGLSVYRLPILIVGCLLTVLGAFIEGGLASDRAWQVKAAELEVARAKAETAIAKQDVKIVERVVVKTKVVKTKGQEIIKVVAREATKSDSKFSQGGQCEMPPVFYESYNKSLELTK
jgi:hypothetical protein